MSEQTRQLAERIARDLFTGYHVNGWTEAGLTIRIEKHLRHAAGASVPQEAAPLRDWRARDKALQRIWATLGLDGDLADPLDIAEVVARLTGEASSAPQGER